MSNLRADFERDGFVILRNFFSKEEMSRLLDEIKKAGASKENPGGEDTARLTFMHNLYRRNAALQAFHTQPKVIELMTEIGGPSLWIRWDHAVEKAPGGEEYPWHQDNGYSKLKDQSFQLWVAVTDADEQKGGLWFQRGSHKHGVRPHRPFKGAHLTCDEKLGEEFYLSAKAGDVAVFSSYILHRSDPNLTSSSRWVLITEYMSKAHYDPTIRAPYFMAAEGGKPSPKFVATYRGKLNPVNQLKYYRYMKSVQVTRHALKKAYLLATGKNGAGKKAA